MSFRCDLCGKGALKGGAERRTGTRGFLKKRLKRHFKPNLRRVKVMTAGGIKRMRLCTKCLKKTKVVEE
ncbi:hypothetical protein B5M47_03445 [candidate division CPR3 bacterium 4484_211]|uniref:Large ribosomal subunit protein bL28 n=1 Tax=candidate division CPR3 bacterium 4484_211 TaxID=1968527 RepID=A0A1W9NX19_UNCC3|nr:MAG: hypothetical protein B5M47_03445 [candidate division CPR3 bacterium 4484_211]